MNFDDEYILDELHIEDSVDEFDNESVESNDLNHSENDTILSNVTPKKEPLEVRIINTESKNKKVGRLNHVITHITEINLFLFMMTIFLCTLQFKKGFEFFGAIISLWIHLFIPSKHSNCIMCNNINKQK